MTSIVLTSWFGSLVFCVAMLLSLEVEEKWGLGRGEIAWSVVLEKWFVDDGGSGSDEILRVGTEVDKISIEKERGRRNETKCILLRQPLYVPTNKKRATSTFLAYKKRLVIKSAKKETK
jgi:hypothetical protein